MYVYDDSRILYCTRICLDVCMYVVMYISDLLLPLRPEALDADEGATL